MTAGRRRTYGTGALSHLGGDRYRLQIRADGKQLSRTFTARNATEANRMAGALRSELIEEHRQQKKVNAVDEAYPGPWHLDADGTTILVLLALQMIIEIDETPPDRRALSAVTRLSFKQVTDSLTVLKSSGVIDVQRHDDGHFTFAIRQLPRAVTIDEA